MNIVRIPGFSRYTIDDNGVVYSMRGIPMRYRITKGNDREVSLYGDDNKLRCLSVGVLMLLNFGNNDNGDFVDYVDGDKSNLCIDNLRWISRSERMIKAYQDKDNKIEPMEYVDNRSSSARLQPIYVDGIYYKSVKDACDELGVSRGIMNKHLRGTIRRRRFYATYAPVAPPPIAGTTDTLATEKSE